MICSGTDWYCTLGPSEYLINVLSIHLDRCCLLVARPKDGGSSHSCQHGILVSLEEHLLKIHPGESEGCSLISKEVAECIVHKLMYWVVRELQWGWDPDATVLLVIIVRNIHKREYLRCCIFNFICLQTNPFCSSLIIVPVVKELIAGHFCNDLRRINESWISSNYFIVSNYCILHYECYELFECWLKILLIHDIDQGPLILESIAEA